MPRPRRLPTVLTRVEVTALLARANCALPKSVPRLPQRLAAGINTYKVNKCNLLTEFTPIYSIA